MKVLDDLEDGQLSILHGAKTLDYNLSVLGLMAERSLFLCIDFTCGPMAEDVTRSSDGGEPTKVDPVFKVPGLPHRPTTEKPTEPTFKVPGLPHRLSTKTSETSVSEPDEAQYKNEDDENEKPVATPYGLSLLAEEKAEKMEEPEEQPPPNPEVPCLYTPPFWRYVIS